MTRISMSLISLIQAVFKIYKYWIIVAIVCNVAHLSYKIFLKERNPTISVRKKGIYYTREECLQIPRAIHFKEIGAVLVTIFTAHCYLCWRL